MNHQNIIVLLDLRIGCYAAIEIPISEPIP